MVATRVAPQRLPRHPVAGDRRADRHLHRSVVFVLPALEQQKVVPRCGALGRGEARSGRDRIASYRLNRWNPAFRFYVGRHVDVPRGPERSRSVLRVLGAVLLHHAPRGATTSSSPAASSSTCVYEREGMWATSGRALWRNQHSDRAIRRGHRSRGRIAGMLRTSRLLLLFIAASRPR